MFKIGGVLYSFFQASKLFAGICLGLLVLYLFFVTGQLQDVTRDN